MIDQIKRALLFGILILLAIAVVSYAADYAVLRYRVAKQKNPFDQVTVTPVFAVKLKDGKTEFDFQPPQIESCANSLYPHLGMEPCWYLKRHLQQRTDL